MEHSTPRVTIHMAASLDGFIARNNGAVDWMETADTFEGGDTMAPEFVAAFLATINCYVMGSRTYETALDFEARGMGGRSLGPRQSRLEDILVTNPRETAMFAELIAVNRIDTQSGEGYEGRIGKGRTMEIAGLSGQPESVLEQAAAMLVEEFEEPRGWPTLARAREEVATVLREGFARGRPWGDGSFSATLIPAPRPIPSGKTAARLPSLRPRLCGSAWGASRLPSGASRS